MAKVRTFKNTFEMFTKFAIHTFKKHCGLGFYYVSFSVFPSHQGAEEMATTQRQLKVNPCGSQLRYKSRNETNAVQRKKN